MSEELIHYKLNAIFTNKWTVVVPSLISSILLVLILKQYIPLNYLIIWALFVTGFYLLRLGLGVVYRSEVSDPYKFLKLHRWFTVLSAFAYGCVSFLGIGSTPYQVDGVMIAFIVGMACGGGMSNIADRFVGMSFVLCLIVPFMIRIYIQQGPYYQLYLVTLGLILFALTGVIKRVGVEVLKSAQLSFERNKFLEEEQKRFALQQELEEEKLKSLNASKFASIGEMAAGIGHEINNPLTIVMGHHWKLEKALESAANQEANVELKKAQEATLRIGEIVKSMRHLSRVNVQQRQQTFETGKIVEAVMPLLYKNLQETGVEVVLPTRSCEAKGHISEYAQTLLGLLHNAIQALEASTENIVMVECICNNDVVELSVSNPGDEISHEIQERMFQPFFTTREIGKGTGLGLSLAKRNMDNNGGDLTYTHISGNNIFTMKMPGA